jgi:hypothetical protein
MLERDSGSSDANLVDLGTGLFHFRAAKSHPESGGRQDNALSVLPSDDISFNKVLGYLKTLIESLYMSLRGLGSLGLISMVKTVTVDR